jgi:hypothetical protein
MFQHTQNRGDQRKGQITIDLKGNMLNSEHAGGDWRVPQFNGALLSTSLLQIKKDTYFLIESTF